MPRSSVMGMQSIGLHPGEEHIVKIRLSIDRFEGDRKQIAVLLAEDGTAINFPRAVLPEGTKAGDLHAPRSIATPRRHASWPTGRGRSRTS
jgi:Protein of unknown function (DUF3006)